MIEELAVFLAQYQYGHVAISKRADGYHVALFGNGGGLSGGPAPTITEAWANSYAAWIQFNRGYTP